MPLSKLAACYLRVSTDEQTEFSPNAQLAAIRDYAKRNGYILLDQYIFKDEGISGRKAEKRPEFMRMVATAKENPAPFEVILVHKIDRFARSREDSVVYKSLLRKECGVKVISITENIEDDKFSVILEAMLEAMAEYYSLNLSEEVKKGMTEKAKRGGLQATPSFGYKVKDNILVPIPEESEIIKIIFERFVAGEGYFSIARQLNELGIKTHRGNKFENRTIEYMIRNPVYIGKLRWNPVGKTKRGDYDNSDIILVDSQHEPIINLDTWEAAQKRVQEVKAHWRKHMRPSTEHKDWLSGLVKCSACGSIIIRSTNQYWKCRGYSGGFCTQSQHVSDEKLKRMVLECLTKEAKANYNLEYSFVNTSLKSETEREILLNQLSKIAIKLDRVKEAYYGGVDTLEEYKSSKVVIEIERESLQNRLAMIEEEQFNIDYSKLIRENLKLVTEMLSMPNVGMKEKHNIAHDSIKEIVYNKANNEMWISFFASVVP